MENFNEGDSAGCTSKVRCDRSVEVYQQNAVDATREFDFERFALYLQLRNEAERKRRLHSVQLGEQVTSMTDFTHDVLADELFSIYGPMDRSTEKFQKILNVYRDQRLEEIAEWIAEEKDIEIDKSLCDDLVASSEPELTTFSREEVEMFQQVRQGAASGYERFILPRQLTKDISCCRSFAATAINLAEFDPQVQLPQQCAPPTSASSKGNIDELLASALQELTYKAPAGITPTELSVVFQQMKKKNRLRVSPNHHEVGFADFLLDQRHALWPQQCNMEAHARALIYPTYLEGLISTPMEIFWRILHQLKAILSLSSGVIKVKEAISLYDQLFGFKLNDDKLKLWGFNTGDDFVQFLFNHWHHPRIKCVLSTELHLVNNDLYLLHCKESSSKLIQTRVLRKVNESGSEDTAEAEMASSKKISKSVPAPAARIPSDCVTDCKQFDHEMFGVKKGRETRCKLSCYFNPCLFYVNLSCQVLPLETFQVALRKQYELEKSQRLHVTNPQLLRNGLPLVVWDVKDQEFYRASFEEEVEPNLYKLRSLDFGYVLHTGLENISFLLESMARKLPGQAIPCQLYKVLESSNWGGAVGEYCRDLLENADWITVSFKERHVNTQGRKVYLVRATVVSKEKTLDVGDEVKSFMKDSTSTEANTQLQARISTATAVRTAFPPDDISIMPNHNDSSQPQYSQQRQQASSTRVTTSNPANPARFRWKPPAPVNCSKRATATAQVPYDQVEARSINVAKVVPPLSHGAPGSSASFSRGGSLKSWAQVTETKSKMNHRPRDRNELDFPPL